jgi:hypothetical protein
MFFFHKIPLVPSYIFSTKNPSKIQTNFAYFSLVHILQTRSKNPIICNFQTTLKMHFLIVFLLSTIPLHANCVTWLRNKRLTPLKEVNFGQQDKLIFTQVLWRHGGKIPSVIIVTLLKTEPRNENGRRTLQINGQVWQN